MKRVSNTKEFIEKANLIHNNKYDYSKVEYVDTRTKVCIICPVHGEFWQKPSIHLLGNGCQKCGREKTINSHNKSQEQFLQEAKVIHGDKYDYSKVTYINAKTKVCIICKEHGEFWQNPFNHLHGQGCNKCKYVKLSLKLRSSKEEFVKKASVIHNNFYDYSKGQYITNRIKMLITCPIHGDFLQEPHEHLVGYGCPKCYRKSLTKLFNDLIVLLPDLKYEVTCKVIPWILSLRIDMYSCKYNIAVECDGPLHYGPLDVFGGEEAFKETIRRDLLKEKLCSENGCKLFRIRYDYTKEDLSTLKSNIINIINL